MKMLILSWIPNKLVCLGNFQNDCIISFVSIFSLEIQDLAERSPRREGESNAQRRRRIEQAWVQTHLRRLLDSSPTEGEGGGEEGSEIARL